MEINSGKLKSEKENSSEAKKHLRQERNHQLNQAKLLKMVPRAAETSKSLKNTEYFL
jgi:hypothetical protein